METKVLTDKEINSLRDGSVVRVSFEDRQKMVVRIARFTRLGIYAHDVSNSDLDNYPFFFYYGDILEIITR